MRRAPWMVAGVAAVLWAVMPARAQEVSLKDIAEAERAEKAALKKVEAAHGNKPPQELSSEERGQIIREQQEASGSALEQRSVDRKAFAKRQMRLSPTERAQVDAEKTRMDQEEKERAAAAAANPPELEITRGIDEKHPVDMYRAPGEPEIEHLSDGSGGEEEPAAKPSKSQKSHKPPRIPGPTRKSIRGHKSRRK